MPSDTDGAREFQRHRPRLFALAYRMLGSATEAEDAVQDTYLRWHEADRENIGTPVAWLTTVVTNLCRNRLTSARAQRERYPGPWLPEPVATGPGADHGLGPLETTEQRESVSLGLLALMERLSPSERAVFVLHEAFDHDHREIAAILDVNEPSSRQLLRRARQRLAEQRPRYDPAPQAWRQVVELFLAAANGGDLTELEQRLADDVVAYADGGGRVAAARRPVEGRDLVGRYLNGFLRNGARLYELAVAAPGTAMEMRRRPAGRPLAVLTPIEVNALPALLVLVDGTPAMVQQFQLRAGEVATIHTIANPDKLGFLTTQLRTAPLGVT
ncbi:RNA polymerase sigma-70 factor (ECF subfamily) [Lipingzhangella halophila]|uniref:RNA polymerase sigma-70 factor (ECF subfamily) n=1 Tax=Lipingzhangella halophila TaxID=1783352 RepID=A0A7W7W2C2_9ACTN|nr:sigma-70 family RNA polymerase sigma factor [Lipingzhangella halophila]MBB4931606.1 RNA polymerase sigma-70 factor (ECF subfamily) [Lipingzhangella halophila]